MRTTIRNNKNDSVLMWMFIFIIALLIHLRAGTNPIDGEAIDQMPIAPKMHVFP